MAKQSDEIRILTVTDDPSAPRELGRMLGENSDTRIVFADTANAVARTFESEQIDMVVIHVDRSDPTLLETATRQARDQDRFIPLIAVVNEDDERSAMAAASVGVEGFVSQSANRQLKRLTLNQIESLKARRDARQALQNLEDIEARYSLLLDSSSEAIAYLHEGLHIYANPAYLDLFGFISFDELEGLSMLDLFTPTEEAPDLKKVLRALSRDDIPREAMTLNAHRKEGNTFTATVSFSPARYGGEYCAQMLVREQVSQSDPELAEELEKLKTSDMLTGLLNSPAFKQALGEKLSSRQDTSGISVLLMTLDDRDELLEKVGMGATDALIRESAELFRKAAGDQYTMARLHDHTFALVADLKNREQAEQLAGHLLEQCSDKIIDVRDTTLTVTASVGLAVAGSEVDDQEQLIEQADSALHEALRAGGNGFVRYRPRVSTEEDGDDAVWTERLRHALDNDEFGLVASPITCMEDDSFLINEIETRLRAEDSDEVLLPSVYMGPASRVGLAGRIDLVMIKLLGASLADKKTDAINQDWLVPLSLETISSQEMTANLAKLLIQTGLDPKQVIWGLREPEIREKLRPAQAFIEHFRPKGFRFSLCDVRPETNIEPLLQNLDLDFVRLSPEMVHDLGNNDKLRQNLSTLVSHVHSHDVRIIAPKVEHTGDLATLWQFGITLVQGDFVREEASA